MADNDNVDDEFQRLVDSYGEPPPVLKNEDLAISDLSLTLAHIAEATACLSNYVSYLVAIPVAELASVEFPEGLADLLVILTDKSDALMEMLDAAMGTECTCGCGELEEDEEEDEE